MKRVNTLVRLASLVNIPKKVKRKKKPSNLVLQVESIKLKTLSHVERKEWYTSWNALAKFSMWGEQNDRCGKDYVNTRKI